MNRLPAALGVAEAPTRNMPKPALTTPSVHDTWWSEESGSRPSRPVRSVIHDKWWIEEPGQSSTPNAASATGALLFPYC
jgi:hypothetical protein